MTRVSITRKINVRDPSALPAWRTSLSPWEWYSIPNTQLSSVAPSPVPPGITGPRSKVDAWCGATLKRSGSVYLIGAAGGHGDYAGNEVNALELGVDVPGWVELRAPTADVDLLDQAEVYADGRRAATHTYYNTQFLDSQNRMVIMPAPGMFWDALPSPSASYPYRDGANVMCAFSMATNDWLDPVTIQPWPGTGDFTSALACKNPATDDLYYARNNDSGRFWKWTAATNTWSQLAALWHQNYAGSAIDPTRGRMLIVGDYSGTMDPRVIDITTGASVSASFGGLGAAVLRMNGYPGVVYDEELDEFLVVKNTNPITVYRVAAGTYSVSEAVMTGTVPASRTNGIQNSVQYAPELKGIVLCNEYSGNVKFMATA